MSPIVATMLKCAGIPAVLVAAGVFASAFLTSLWREKLQALIVAMGFVFGSYLLIGRLSVPPHDVSEALSFAAILLAAFVFVSPRTIGSRYLIRALFVLGIGFILLWPLGAQLNSDANKRNILAFFCLGLGVWSILEKSTRSTKPLAVILLPLLSMTAVSFQLLFSGSASLSQLLAVACASLGGALAVAVVWPSRVAVSALVPFLSVFAVAFMVVGHFYLDINPWKLIYLCVPYLLLWIRVWLPFVPKDPLREAVVLGILAVAPLAYFVWTAFKVAGPLY